MGLRGGHMVKDEEKRKTTFDRIGRRLRESVDKVKEDEIIEEKDEISEEFMPSLFFGVGYREDQEAQKLKHRLMKEYSGKRLNDVIAGKEFKTKIGTCYHIENQVKINLKIIDPYKARDKILSDLKVIRGIWEITERNLKKEGYKTVEDLIRHPRYGSEAKTFVENIDKCNADEITALIDRRFPKSHPLVLYSSSFYKKEDFIFLDIETMGLFTRPIILFGIAQISDNDMLIINQYFVRNIKEEPAALDSLLFHFKENCAFITFNGRTFDIPYIKERLAYYRMKDDFDRAHIFDRAHFDMLFFSKRAWGSRMSNCKLATLEKHLLGIERKDDVPDALIPDFYDTYMRTKNIGPLIPIIQHNKQDLISIAILFVKLHTKWGQ